VTTPGNDVVSAPRITHKQQQQQQPVADPDRDEAVRKKCTPPAYSYFLPVKKTANQKRRFGS